MPSINRKAALAVGLGAATSLVLGPRDVALAAVGDETKVADGVTLKILGEGESMIPGYKKVRLRDFTVQPGGINPARKMNNPMVCHVLAGELQVEQTDPSMGTSTNKFTAKQGHVWTCNLGTTEGFSNTGTVVGVMRITDLLP
jgi:hypothetical protein